MYFTPLTNPSASMPMAEQFTPITRPSQSHVNIDTNRRSCPSEGFNYPTFRLVNKNTRVYLSEPFTLDSLITYHPFAVANTKGWFAAVRKIGDAQDIILSPLKDLRDSISSASEDDKGLFFPQRDLSLDVGLPTTVAFALNDTRLVVGVDNGSIYVYDTAKLFSSGSDSISPLRTHSPQAGALRQIAPNPGTEPDLVDTVAVVRSDGVVQLMNTMLESLGGWSSADSNASPVAVSWSPKGKHLAIGLQSGDILTFAPNNMSTPNKHIPPAADGRLVGLNWLSPGYTFRLTYAPQIANEGESIQQIVSLDTKSNILAVFDTLHPFTMPDRQQESHALILPHWDEDSISENSKSLILVGDRASIDLEILGGHSGQWYQQSQENPVSLPLDKQTEETTLMSLDLDLTDPSTPTPIVYAYLNDGSLQAWYLEHSKPYLRMVSSTAETVSVTRASADVSQDSAMDEKDAANVLTSFSNLNQPPPTSTFGGFVSDTGQQSPVFGATSQPMSVFGQTSQPAFGQTSGFGSPSPGSSPFGQPSSFGPSQSISSVFGTSSSGNAFANIAAQRDTTNVFGTSSFGTSSSLASPPTQLAPPSDEMTREASMSDGTAPAFGGLSLGGGSLDTGDKKPQTSIFGSFGTTPSTNQPASSAFGGLIKPAQGFGAFSNFGSAASADTSSQEKPSVSAFSSLSPPTPHSAFGQTGFGKPAFGQPSFGQTSFGQTGFGAPSSAAAIGSREAGFAAFASSSPSSFNSALQAQGATSSASGGFSTFASGGTRAFGSGSKAEEQSVSGSNTSPISTKAEPAKLPFGSEGGASPFGNASSSAFASSTSGFGLRGSAEATTTPQSSPIKPPPGVMSPPSSPEPSKPGSPFDNKKAAPAPPSSSFLRESTAFSGLKAMQESSPFFKKHEDKATPVTAFGNIGQAPTFKPLSSTTATASPAFGATSQLGAGNKSPFSNVSTVAPAFGATSQLGAAPRSVFGSTTPTTTPTKPATGGGFSAFSGANTGFSAFAGQKTKFSDLLKSGDKDERETGKHTTDTVKEAEKEPSTPSKPVPVLASSTPTPTKTSPASVSTTPKTPILPTVTKQEESTTPREMPDEEKPEPPTSTLSVSSIGSFVDISADKSCEDDREGDDDVDDTRSFLSSDFSSEPPTDDEESEEEGQAARGRGKLPEVSEGRSPSPTPQPEVPSIRVSSSPPAEAGQARSSKEEESTTPPGSPSGEAKAPSKSPSPTPFSASSTSSSPSPSPFGIGLGRPSTRPARSSPLAAAPVSGEEEEEEEGQVKEEPVSKPLASPKPVLSRLSPAREEPVKQEDDDSTLRPKTPPLLSSFSNLAAGKATPTMPVAPKPELAKTPFSLTPTPGQQPVSVFSKPPEGPEAPKTAPVTPTSSPFSLPPFSLAPKSASAPQSNQATPSPVSLPVKPPVFAQNGPSTFSTLPKPSTGVQSGPITPNLFSTGTTTNAFGVQFDQNLPTTPQSAPLAIPMKPTAPRAAPPATPAEEGLQKECTVIVKMIENELVELCNLGAKAAQKRAELSQATGGSRLKADLGSLVKWKISDAMTFGQTLLQFEKDLVELGSIREAAKQTLRELNSNMLKAHTRREEIARFNKAKTDKEFAKMLSTRSLGPEHLESQQQLRRGIRAMRDRIQKLESHLQESKKKLSQASSGRPSIRAPTLDVINRTYRNIDLAIQQQTDEMARLADRIAKLKVGPSSSPSLSRDPRLPDRQRRNIAITPHVAVTTAAALNAERSAQKLKKALLKVRKEPILNVGAALAPPPPSELETPQKLPAGLGVFGPVSEPLFTPSGENGITIPDMNFNLPEDNFHPGTPLPSSRRGAGSNPKKHGSVPLKKTSSGATQSPPLAATPAADFWGPLPVFNNPPLNKLAAEVKPIVSFVPLTPPTPSTPTPTNKAGPLNPLPGGGFEAFMKHPS